MSWDPNKPPVGKSADLARILTLSRREPVVPGTPEAEALIEHVTAKYSIGVPSGECSCAAIMARWGIVPKPCITRLNYAQAWMLHELRIYGGLMAHAATGIGKTVVDILGALAKPGCRVAVLLVPPTLCEQLAREWELVGQHFRVPSIIIHHKVRKEKEWKRIVPGGGPTLHVLPYSRLSRPESSVYLEQVLKPDLILADECFPGHTLIDTDAGLIPISDIVDNGKANYARSYSAKTGWSYKRITSRWNRGIHSLVRVHHQNGFFDCTPEHKIWTENRGYAKAETLTASDVLRASLPELRKTSSVQTQVNLFEGLPDFTSKQAIELVTSAAELRCGSGRSGDQTGDRDRWRDSQVAEVEVPGQAQNRNLEFPRVVRVEVLEQRSSDGVVTRDGNACVYDIEVEDNHNFVADGILVSNCQNVAGLQAVRTGRLVRYFEIYGDAISMASYSGSITDDSITDYSALSALSLKRRSPLPLDPHTSDVWATAIDPDPLGLKAPMGALRALCRDHEDLEDGFARLLSNSPGFVITTGASIDIPLEIKEKAAPEIPDVPKQDPRAPGMIDIIEPGWWPGVATALDSVRNKWVRPDGEILLDQLSVGRCARELACGLFLKWKFVRGETKPQIDEWKAARKEWRSELREMLKQRRPHMDSPMLCALAAMRAWGHLPKRPGQADIVVDLDEEGKAVEAEAKYVNAPDAPSWKAASWPRWFEVRKTVQPITEDVRLDPFLAQDAADWGTQNKGIIWYQTVAFGKWVAELGKLTMHGGGPKAGERLAKERGDRSIVCSIKSHGTGRDGLQRLYSTQLIAQPLASAVGIEQLLGRLSRIGQEADIVHALVYRHTKEIRKSFDAAIRKATYVAKTLRTEQKLLVGWNPDENPDYDDEDAE